MTILLHICCGICSGWAIEKLKIDGFQVVGFFYNPNIQPEEEYAIRLAAAQKASGFHQIEFIAGQYDTGKWHQRVKEFKNEPEGGKRCPICFEFRLEETWKKAKELKIDYFTTTLTASPHKNFELISQIGKSISADGFIPYNFKKEDGFKKCADFSKKHGLYRQNYCGCIFNLQGEHSQRLNLDSV